ncbi:MAG: threonine--tRNA ligase [Mariprofundales bacterium]
MPNINITLPDQSVRSLVANSTVADLAASIGSGLARAAIAARINQQICDLSTPLQDGDAVSIITANMPEALEVIRHSCAHLMAQAVQELFPETQVTIGPVIEDGFFYDFARETSFSPEDLQAIEKRMRVIASRNTPVERVEISREDGMKHFENIGEHFKVQLIERIAVGETISLYKQGEWSDLCSGPHVPHTGKIRAFKLMKLAGSYWQGDAKGVRLQRIYGTCWSTEKELKAYVHRLEEAEKRDHRKLAKKLNLFHLQDEAPGMVFWHPKGWSLWQVIEQYIRGIMIEHDYQEIRTPQIVDRSLWEKSGHWEKFRDDMFTISTDNRDYAIKPMNCPCHVQVFKQELHSYRDLPIRLGEFGSCHRNEPSGTLHGLMRLRNFVQDDAHIFCTPEQIGEEVGAFIDLVFAVYKRFGFDDIIIKFSDRPEKRVGSDEQWDKAEKALQDSLQEKELEYGLNPGEGAFYGPKIEFSLRDCLGRVWQCGTIQVDFSMPERLGAEYVAHDNSRQTPVMLHRAILGSLERFLGILIEQHAGAFPLWLAPIQAVICNISDSQAEYAQKVHKQLQANGFRTEVDLRNEKIGYKIRANAMQRVPFILVVGERECDENTVNVRERSGKNLGVKPLDSWIEEMKQQCLDAN